MDLSPIIWGLETYAWMLAMFAAGAFGMWLIKERRCVVCRVKKSK